HLKIAVQRCLKYAVVMDLWIKVRMLEVKRQHESLEFHERLSKFVPSVLTDEDGKLVQQLLLNSLTLLKAALPTDKHPCYRYIVANMGIIQESRLRGLNIATDGIKVKLPYQMP